MAIALPTFIGLVNGLYNPFLHKTATFTFWLLDFVHFWIVPLGIIFLLYKKYGIHPREYGLAGASKNYPAWEMIGAGVLVAIVLVLAWYIFWYIGLFFFGSEDFRFSFGLVIPEDPFRIPTVIYLAISAGFAEELVFRGFTWSAVSELKIEQFRKPLYLIFSSLLFAAVHWEQGAASVTGSFGFGLVAAAFYLQIKNLWSLIAAHSFADIYFFI